MIDGGSYDVHGFRFRITAECETPAVDDLASDFAYFATRNVSAAFEIRLCPRPPDYTGVPPAVASVYTPRNIAVIDGPRKYLDYGGRGLALYDQSAGLFQMQSIDRKWCRRPRGTVPCNDCGHTGGRSRQRVRRKVTVVTSAWDAETPRASPR